VSPTLLAFHLPVLSFLGISCTIISIQTERDKRRERGRKAGSVRKHFSGWVSLLLCPWFVSLSAFEPLTQTSQRWRWLRKVFPRHLLVKDGPGSHWAIQCEGQAWFWKSLWHLFPSLLVKPTKCRLPDLILLIVVDRTIRQGKEESTGTTRWCNTITAYRHMVSYKENTAGSMVKFRIVSDFGKAVTIYQDSQIELH
jgi:hypothetical protein